MMIEHSAIREGVPLAPYTTYKVGGQARLFAEPDDLEDLRSILLATPDGIPVFILGRGSNVVISDAGFDGLVLRLGRSFAAIEVRDDGLIVAGGATPLPKLARAAAVAGRSGLSFFVGIPGSVGGAVRMNAGGHGSDTSAVLTSVIIVDADTADIRQRTSELLELGYRSSNLGETDIIAQATFATSDGDPTALEGELREITRWRKEHQPGGTLNAGSVFKNPAGAYAGQIIDELGLKGHSVGPVSVSSVHANFMVADSGAKAIDIYRFVHNIQARVREHTGNHLEPEIRFVGEFEEDDSR
jgi:UDP-N-acetylmuramate dehydrogenase